MTQPPNHAQVDWGFKPDVLTLSFNGVVVYQTPIRRRWWIEIFGDLPKEKTTKQLIKPYLHGRNNK